MRSRRERLAISAIHLTSKGEHFVVVKMLAGLAANTINQQLAGYDGWRTRADVGPLSPELAAGISPVKGVKQLGFRAGNWLSAEESSEVLQRASGPSLCAKRDYAMLAMLFGWGFRTSELVGLEMHEIQMRHEHWAGGRSDSARAATFVLFPFPNGSKSRSINGQRPRG